MSDLERHGNGMSGRVDGPLFDALHILGPASMAMGGIVEPIQTEIQAQADGGHLDNHTGFLEEALYFAGSMPYDAKAAGLALAAAGAVTAFSAGRTIRDIAIENSIIGAGLDRASAVEPLRRRAVKRVGVVAVAGLTAVVAYKTGEQMSATADLATDFGAMVTGLVYLNYTRKRMGGSQ